MRALRHFPSILVCTVALTAIAGCAYVIPEDPNQPRNNTVLGGPRRPMLNNTMAPQSAAPQRSPASAVSQIDVPPVAGSTDEMANMAPAAGGNERRSLSGNAPYQVSASNYPDLNSVPPRPVMEGEASTGYRLKQTERTLEADRAIAFENKERLAADAAAEPSMLQQLPAQATPTQTAPAPHVAPQPQSFNAVSVPQMSEVRSVATTQVVAADAATLAPAAGGPTAQPVGITLAKLNTTTPSLPASPVFAPPVLLNNTTPSAPAPQQVQFQPQPRLVPAMQPVAAVAPQPVQPVTAYMPEQPTQAPLSPVVKIVSVAPAMEPVTPQAEVQPVPLSGRVAPMASVGQPNPETFSPLVSKKDSMRLGTIDRDFNPLAPFAEKKSPDRVAYAPTMKPAPTAQAVVQPQLAAAVPVPARVVSSVGGTTGNASNAPNVTIGDFNPLTPVAAVAPAAAPVPVTAANAATIAPAAGGVPAIRRGDFDPMATSTNAAPARPAYISPSRYAPASY